MLQGTGEVTDKRDAETQEEEEEEEEEERVIFQQGCAMRVSGNGTEKQSSFFCGFSKRRREEDGEGEKKRDRDKKREKRHK